jgi:ubiquinol-cytochrome c reductase cytochrome c subunit
MSAAPEQIAEAVRIGPGVMPTFGTDVIAPSELDDIVSYVGMLQNRSRANNPGGLQLANIGPVAEGFVAWFFGIGLLVLLCRRIGTTD